MQRDKKKQSMRKQQQSQKLFPRRPHWTYNIKTLSDILSIFKHQRKPYLKKQRKARRFCLTKKRSLKAEIIKKWIKQILELKRTITEMKNLLEGLKSWSEQADRTKNHEPEDRSTEMDQSKDHNAKGMKRPSQSLKGIQGNQRHARYSSQEPQRRGEGAEE